MNTAQDISATSFTKLRSGAWGVKGNAALITDAIRNECAVTVTTRTGETKQVQPEKIVWTGNGVAIATIVDNRPARRSSSTRRRSECSECGEHGPAGHACTNCFEGHYS